MRKALIFVWAFSLLLQIRAANAELEWKDSHSDALAEAQNRKKPVLIFFSLPNCDKCLKFEEEVFNSLEVSKLLAEFVLVKVSEAEIFKQYQVPMHHNIVILDQKGQVFTRIWGPFSLKRFNEVMEVAYISILTFETESALSAKAYGETSVALSRASSLIQDKDILRKHFSERLEKVKQIVETVAQKRLKAAEDKMMEKDYLASYATYYQMAREFEGLEAAEKAKEEMDRLESDPALRKEIQRFRFNAILATAENAKQQDRYDEALKIYQELLTTFAETAYAREVPEKIVSIKEAITKMQRLKREAEMSALFDKAQKLAAKHNFQAARETYDELIQKYPGTEYAKSAAEEKLKVVDKLAGSDCQLWMSFAASWLLNKNKERALEYYRKVVEKHPDSSYAKEARSKIEEITQGE